jgi:flavodoxin
MGRVSGPELPGKVSPMRAAPSAQGSELTRQTLTQGEGMETVIVYDSKFGTTRKIAETIAEAVRPHSGVRVFGLDTPLALDKVDLLIVGGPTQAHGMSPRMRQFTKGLAARPGTGMVAATFDTRYRMPTAISGSAAKAIARRLKRTGIHLFVPPESFFVMRGAAPELEAGEPERAAAWAQHLVSHLALSHWCAA